jgi:segregation and condensation protein A
VAQTGARLAIRMLQEAALQGEIDPWDVDVIAVIDGFLDQLRQRIGLPRLVAVGGSYEQDLAESSEAFLAASVLVGLKAEVLESATFPPEPVAEAEFGFEEDDDGQLSLGALLLPRRPERHLQRRPVAPPPLQRPVTLGELIRQLEEIADQLERDEGSSGRGRTRNRRYSERAAIAQVANLAHREKLPETTAALAGFLSQWPPAVAGDWIGFDALVEAWAANVTVLRAAEELDQDRVGVFWALLFLCSQGKVELEQEGGLFAPLTLRSLGPAGSAAVPALEVVAA